MQQPTPPHLPGTNVMFTLSVTAPALSYQWQVNGRNVIDTFGRYEGTNTTILTVLNLMDADNGAIVSCMVSDGGDQVTTEPVSVRIRKYNTVL